MTKESEPTTHETKHSPAMYAAVQAARLLMDYCREHRLAALIVFDDVPEGAAEFADTDSVIAQHQPQGRTSMAVTQLFETYRQVVTTKKHGAKYADRFVRRELLDSVEDEVALALSQLIEHVTHETLTAAHNEAEQSGEAPPDAVVTIADVAEFVDSQTEMGLREIHGCETDKDELLRQLRRISAESKHGNATLLAVMSGARRE